MIADDVAGVDDFAGDVGSFPDETSHEKNVAFTSWRARTSRRWKVCGSFGPSSYVKAICFTPRGRPMNV